MNNACKLCIGIGITILLCVSCGNSIKDAQDFIPNKTPVVTTFTVQYIGTDTAYNSNRLYTGMPFLVTVNAYDPEKSTLTYSVTSNSGTFSTQTKTATGITCTFYIGAITGGDPIQITLAVSDQKNASFIQTHDVGKGKTGPGLSITPPTNSAITPDGDTTMKISCDSEGTYRVYRDNTITSATDAVLGTTGLSRYTTENAVITIPIIGPSSTRSDGVQIASSVKNYIWIVFQDKNEQTAAGYCTMFVEGTNPYVVSSSPLNDNTNISTTSAISFLFNKALAPTTVTDSSITMKSSGGTSVAGTVVYDAPTTTVTFTPSAELLHNTVYTVTAKKSITDTVLPSGNPMLDDYAVSFTTVPEGMLSNPEMTPIAGTYTGTQNVELSNSDPSASIAYTVDGTVPVISTLGDSVVHGTVYTGVISVDKNMTIRAIAYKTGSTASGTAVAAYSIRTSAPEFAFSQTAAQISSGTGAGTLTITGSAAIYYTVDGTDPSGTGGNLLGSGQLININKNMTVRAVTKQTGLTNSAETSESYTVKALTPVFSLTGTSYDSDQTLYITSNSGASIYYTTNGDDPTTSSTLYADGILLTGSSGGVTHAIKAIAVKSGLANSSAGSKSYTIAYGTVSAPVITVVGAGAGVSLFNTTQSVVITCATASADITYIKTIYIYDDAGNPDAGTSETVSNNTSPVILTIDRSTKIEAYAVKSPKAGSAHTIRMMTLQVPEPTVITYPANGMELLMITDDNLAANIYYTTDGMTTPSTAHILYTNATSHASDTPIIARGFEDGWIPSDIAYSKYYLYMPYAPDGTNYNAIRIYSVNAVAGVLTDMGNYPLTCRNAGNTATITANIKDCLLNPTKQYLIASTYSVSTTDCNLVTYKINYMDGSLSFVAQSNACNQSTSFTMAFDSSGSYLLGHFYTPDRWQVRPYFINAGGSISPGTAVDNNSIGQEAKLFSRPSYQAGSANFYAVQIASPANTYPLKITASKTSTTVNVGTGIELTGSTTVSKDLCFNPSGWYWYAAPSMYYGIANSTTGDLGRTGNIGTFGEIESMVFVTTPAANQYVYTGAPSSNNHFGIYTIGSGTAPTTFRFSSSSEQGGVETNSTYTGLDSSNSSFRCLSADRSGRFVFAVAQAATPADYPIYVASFSIAPTTGVIANISALTPGISVYGYVPLKTIIAAP